MTFYGSLLHPNWALFVWRVPQISLAKKKKKKKQKMHNKEVKRDAQFSFHLEPIFLHSATQIVLGGAEKFIFVWFESKIRTRNCLATYFFFTFVMADFFVLSGYLNWILCPSLKFTSVLFLIRKFYPSRHFLVTRWKMPSHKKIWRFFRIFGIKILCPARIFCPSTTGSGGP